MKILKRDISAEFKVLLKEYPVVLISGPRQSGKTTLVKTLKGYQYRNLENPETRSLALEDPKAFFASFKNQPVILDEIQTTPSLFSWIQVIVDEKHQNGQFVLTGSGQVELMEKVTQSLAGRVGLLNLLTFSISELKRFGVKKNSFEYFIHKGFLPRIYSQNQRPLPSYANYYRTYVERDVRKQINIKDQSLFENFIKLMAGRVGQTMNYHSLCKDTGVSAKTIKHWCSVLEASFIIYKLNPYFENFGKRVIKSPKYYFTEVGLLSYLLGLQSPEQVLRDPLMGSLFENLVVMDCIKTWWNKGHLGKFYFFQDSNHNEIDLLLVKGRHLFAFEIKATSTYTPSLSSSLNKIKKIHPKIEAAYVISNVETKKLSHCTGLIHFKDAGFHLNNYKFPN